VYDVCSQEQIPPRLCPERPPSVGSARRLSVRGSVLAKSFFQNEQRETAVVGTKGNSHISTDYRSVGHSVRLRFEPFIITMYVKKTASVV
jgi:hypothetical protein